jgi:HPt (histidine-containing phosphotransfer) domain-containing protein
MDEAAAAFERADAAAARQAVHTLKSSSANLGATGFSRLCAELEALLREGRLADASCRWPEADTSFARAAEALRALVAPVGGAA